MSNKISVLIDVTVDKALNSLKGFRASISDADGAVNKFKAGSKAAFDGVKANAGLLAAGAATALLKFGGDIINAGVEMEAMDAKAETVFGKSLSKIESWADANAGAMGLTTREAVAAGAAIADLLKPMGFTEEAATQMTGSLLDVSGALSAWSGGKVSATEVSNIFTKAMLGEREGLKSLGISITEAEVTARLAEKGQAGLTGATLAQAKALAVQELIMEKSTDAQVAWADGSMDGVKSANEAKASVAKLSEVMTTSLYPVLVKLVPVIADIAETLVPVAEGFAEITATATDMTFGTKDMSKAYQDFAKAVEEGTPEEAIRDLYNATVDADGGFKALGAAAGVVFGGNDEGTVRWERLVEVFKELSATSPELAAEMYDAMGIIVGSADAGYDSSIKLADQIGLTSDRFKELTPPVKEAAAAVDEVATAVDNTSGPMASANEMLGRYEKAGKEAADAAKELADSQAVLEAAIKKADDALQVMKGHIDDRQAWRNMQEAIEELRVKMADGEASWNDLADASDDVALAMADVIEQAENIPAEVKTRLYQEIDAGNLDEVNKLLERWQLGYRIPLYPKVVTPSGGANPGAVIPIVGAFHDGGVVPGPMGKEQLALVKGGETVLPTHQNGAMGVGVGGVTNLTINAYITAGSDPRQIIDIIRTAQRTGQL